MKSITHTADHARITGRRSIDEKTATETMNDRLVQWIDKRDTVLFEAALGINAILNAVLTVTVNKSGEPVAPFLSSSLKQLAFDPGRWMLLLVIYALLTLVALVHGQFTGNAYFIRSCVQVAGTIFQALIAVAIFTSPMAPAAGARYATTAFWSFVVALVLITKSDVARKKAKKEKARGAENVAS